MAQLSVLDQHADVVVVHNFVQSAEPYVRIDGVQIAEEWIRLIDGDLDAPLEVDEWGEVQTPTTATSDAIIGVAVRRGGGR
ncbi:hypothetical protein [Nannocystis pusilla]|uniref:hypothetical protein n=1 Tax=Nannocystis pusilla TaxID=889268 RepID=UPI003B7C7A22